jgi:hypothetical protein
MMKKINKLEKQVEELVYAINQLMPNGSIKFIDDDGISKYEAPKPDYNTEPDNEAIILNKRAEILRTAEELINGDRALTYGPPEISFGRIAGIWNAMGYRHHVQVEHQPPGITKANELDAVDAALILIGMKLSRTVGNREHLDNWLDLAGYSGLGGELATLLKEEM